MAKRLLAVCYGGGHVAMMPPVLDQLRRLVPGLEVELLALTTARAAARQLGLPAFGYTELLAQWPDAEARREGERLLAGNTHPSVEREESIAYLGLNWMDLVRQHGAEIAESIYFEKGRAGFLPLRLMRRLLADRRPDFVLTTNSPRTEQAAIHAAVEQGIPCLSMFDLFPVPDDPYAHRPVLADITTVISEGARATLLAAGMQPESVVVTGNPGFDSLVEPGLAAAGRDLLTRLGWEDKWVAMYAGYAEPSASAEWPAGTAFPLAIEGVLRSWVDARPGAALVIRQHPNHAHLFRQAWEHAPTHPRIHISWPDVEAVEPWILASQAVVVQVSTVGLQAAVAGKPVLALDQSPSIVSAGFSWSALGVARGVDRLENLTRELDEVRLHPFTADTHIVTPAAPRIAALVAARLQALAASAS